MPRKEIDASQHIQQILSRDQRAQRQKDGRDREAEAKLGRSTGDAVAKYRREVEAARPDAELAINQVIQPWFSELIEIGTYAELLEWSKSHGKDIRLSDSITYHWPKHALAGDKLFREEANEEWHAGFNLVTNPLDKSEGVSIWRQPVVGMGFGFAMAAREYQIIVDSRNTIVSLDKISPEVWIKFGEQIKSGKAWEAIEESLKPKRTV